MDIVMHGQREVMEKNGTQALASVLPIMPGKQEEWRRFCQVLLGSRRHEYEDSRRRLGITKEMVWLSQTTQGDLAIVYLEAEDPERAILQLVSSEVSFDRWFRGQLRELHGLDVGQPSVRLPNELVFVWQRS